MQNVILFAIWVRLMDIYTWLATENQCPTLLPYQIFSSHQHVPFHTFEHFARPSTCCVMLVLVIRSLETSAVSSKASEEGFNQPLEEDTTYFKPLTEALNI